MNPELENMPQNEQRSAEQRESYREGYQSPGNEQQFPSREGKSARPRIRISRSNPQPRRYSNEESYRPEGFGGNFRGGESRPRFQNQGYEQRGYQSRGNYQQGGYGQRPGQFRGGYQQYGGQGGYGQRPSQPRGGYQQYGGQGGYGQRPGQFRGGYQQYGGQGGYQPRNGYQQKPARPRTPGFNPNAKYSQKKRIEYSEAHIDPSAPLRLNKFLANAGVCSRREADDFIQAGVVTVNGQVVTELGTKVLRTDDICFHDQPVSLEKKVYVLLNKPKDYVTTSDDPQNRKTVMDLVKHACNERIYPVGRLDRNTTGVLLLTNDGELASKLTHPKFLKKKVYHVYLDKKVTLHDLKQIAEGIQLDDGEIRADAVDYAHETDKTQVGIEIHSGRNRIVRRIFESLGYRVVKLDRVQFAGLTKKNVRRGDWRYLTEKEVEMLRMGAYE